jgi:bacterioferritin
MKCSPKIISALNEILCSELTAINQYFLHSRMCQNWGYNKLAEKIYAESIDEMKHAKEITDRILYLDGVPNLQKLDKLNIGTNVKEQITSDYNMELIAIKHFQKAIELCYEEKDHGTRKILETMLASEEEHLDWLESQIHIIKEIGYANYLSEQI